MAITAPAIAQPKTYETRYYVIHSDLDENAIREAGLRLTKMAEMYAERTRSFTGKITTRLPFYLFGTPEDYYAAGGLPGSAGVFMGDKLMAIAGRDPAVQTWSTLQHEGFHQFVHAVIRGDIPVWVNEGMAEYFGEARFTGDGMVTGLIPQPRLARVRREIQSGQFKTVGEMMQLENETWIQEMSTANYDQAWSMVHFLGHADGGKYRSRFDGFLQDLSLKGSPWEQAWLRNFDANIEAFENAWRKYWESLPDHPTAHLYAKATVATLTSFLARAHSRKQTFKNANAFFEAARAKALQAHPEDWLPPRLLETALPDAQTLGRWSLQGERRKPPRLICTLGDGTRLTGTFTVNKGRVQKVNVLDSGKKSGISRSGSHSLNRSSRIMLRALFGGKHEYADDAPASRVICAMRRRAVVSPRIRSRPCLNASRVPPVAGTIYPGAKNR